MRLYQIKRLLNPKSKNLCANSYAYFALIVKNVASENITMSV